MSLLGGLFGGGSSSSSSTTSDQHNSQAGDNSNIASGSGNLITNINSGGAPAINLGGANVQAPITFSDYGSVQGALTLAQHVADQAASLADSISSKSFGVASSANSALADQASGGANQNQRTLVLLAVAVVAGVVLINFSKGH